MSMGPKYIVIKKGEHGALLFHKEDSFLCTCPYLWKKYLIPTGAGDTFAGGFTGYLAKTQEITQL